MKLVRPPYLVRKLYNNLIWNFSSTEKIIYLTFDDGPVPEITPWVLDTLKQFNAKATFFCIGSNIEKYPDLFQRILNEGHSVGNHTYDHLNGWKTKDDVYFDNINKCAKLVNTNLFRPPYGKIKRSQVKKLNYINSGIVNSKPETRNQKLIMWDVLSYDFDKNTSPQQCYKNVVINTKAGSIVVFHDSVKASVNLQSALPRALEYYALRNYRFEAITLPIAK